MFADGGGCSDSRAEGQVTRREKDKLAELKRQRRILKGATVTMLFDLLVLWMESKR